MCLWQGLVHGFDDFDFDPGHPFFDHVDFEGGAQGEVEDAAFYEGPPVVDLDDDAAAVVEVGDPDNRAKREFPVGGGEAVHVEDLSAGGRSPVKFVGIVGRETDLIGPLRRNWGEGMLLPLLLVRRLFGRLRRQGIGTVPGARDAARCQTDGAQDQDQRAPERAPSK